MNNGYNTFFPSFTSYIIALTCQLQCNISFVNLSKIVLLEMVGFPEHIAMFYTQCFISFVQYYFNRIRLNILFL